MSDEQVKYPHWQGLYEAAVSESRLPELPEKIHAAEQAIFERLQNLAHDSGYEAERQAIANALSVLRTLQREKLSFPDWDV
jgi:hypothetical protein